MARAAHSLTALLKQINARFPNRDRASDGGIGDAAHRLRISDHNPDNNGVFHARDFDHDPDANGLDCERLNRELRTSGDPRIKYVIFNRYIWWPSGTGRAYTGANAHTSHLHLSVLPGIGDNDSPWRLPMLGLSIPFPTVYDWHWLTRDEVRELQRVLNAWYPRDIRLIVDGLPGPATASAVRFAQNRLRITVDGIPGPVTLSRLGIK